MSDLNLLNKGLDNDLINPNETDKRAKDEQDFLNNDKTKADTERTRTNTSLRSQSTYAFTFIIGFWLVSVLLILVGNNSIYRISDNVLITLLTTTSINVIGMMIIILKGLFPQSENQNPQE